jgi:hypothetical protein
MTSALGPPDIDAEQVEVIQRVALAHPQLSIGFAVEERTGCVHVEIVRAGAGPRTGRAPSGVANCTVARV